MLLPLIHILCKLYVNVFAEVCSLKSAVGFCETELCYWSIIKHGSYTRTNQIPCLHTDGLCSFKSCRVLKVHLNNKSPWQRQTNKWIQTNSFISSKSPALNPCFTSTSVKQRNGSVQAAIQKPCSPFCADYCEVQADHKQKPRAGILLVFWKFSNRSWNWNLSENLKQIKSAVSFYFFTNSASPFVKFKEMCLHCWSWCFMYYCFETLQTSSKHAL